MTPGSGAAVVVGVDGTESARRAVRLAATEAVLRHRPLRVVHALIWPVLRVAPGPPRDGPRDQGLRRRADGIVSAALQEAAECAPGLSVSAEVIDGAATTVLLRESRNAALLVVGHRGLRAISALLVGSVAVHLAAQAHCPVMVTLGERQKDAGPVVVGVDGSQLAGRAVAFAFEEAALRGAKLIAVHAGNGRSSAVSAAAADGDAEADHLVAESVAGWRERYPAVPVTPRLVPDRPARVLLDESARAQLVVTGSRGRGALAGLVLGSVSQEVLRDCRCPLAILRG